MCQRPGTFLSPFTAELHSGPQWAAVSWATVPWPALSAGADPGGHRGMELGLPTLLQASVLPLLLLGGSRELSSHVWEPAWLSLGGGLSQGPHALRATSASPFGGAALPTPRVGSWIINNNYNLRVLDPLDSHLPFSQRT